jgi:pyrroline-5-carboxylate reductase
MAETLSIGFLGAGKMASALAKGFLTAGLVAPENLIASDPFDAARAAFQKETGARTTSSNLEVLKSAQTVFIAVKPAHVAALLTEIKSAAKSSHLFITIASGVPLHKYEAGLGVSTRVIRVMPNTPAMVGASASAYSLGNAATREDGEWARKLLSAVGLAYEVKESLLDAVTGLSGSGPAYIYLVIEALSDGGVAAGLPRDIATRLAAQTVLGSAKMVLETGLHPGALKDMVTSPGGTTIEGIHELEKGGVRAALMSAVRAASDKSKKLGQS